MNSVIGQTLNHIKVHEPMNLFCAGQKPQQCFGALSLWFDHNAMVLRSPRRYSKPGLGDLLNSEPPRGEPAVTLCSHEEAEWLMQAIGIGWQNLPECGRLVMGAHSTDHGMRIEFAANHALWTHYREDLDGCWMVGADEVGPSVTTIELTTPDAAFGWLLPKAPYSILWNGQRWQDLAPHGPAPPNGNHLNAGNGSFNNFIAYGWLNIRTCSDALPRCAIPCAAASSHGWHSRSR
jgi:hypothetical protein